MTLLKSYLARKNEPDQKARTDFTKTLAKNLEADFRDLTLQKITFAQK
jgi:hypothetical protein